MIDQYSIYVHPSGEFLGSCNSLAQAAILAQVEQRRRALAVLHWKYYDHHTKKWFVPDIEMLFDISRQLLRAADAATDCLPGK